MQDCSSTIANTLGLEKSCPKPSTSENISLWTEQLRIILIIVHRLSFWHVFNMSSSDRSNFLWLLIANENWKWSRLLHFIMSSRPKSLQMSSRTVENHWHKRTFLLLVISAIEAFNGVVTESSQFKWRSCFQSALRLTDYVGDNMVTILKTALEAHFR